MAFNYTLDIGNAFLSHAADVAGVFALISRDYLATKAPVF